MKIAMIGETCLPVLPSGGGGLGRATHELATNLLSLGHSVTLYAMQGSKFNGDLREFPVKFDNKIDILIDYSHTHEFSKTIQNALNLIGDRECRFIPHNAVVETEYMRKHYPSACIVKQGCRVDEIPLSLRHGDYLLFMGANVDHKQPDIAREVARRAGINLCFIGPGFEEVSEATKWELLGGALALICPYTIDASPRAPLEAAACGTPTLCFSGDGTKEHVRDGLSGFVCQGIDDMLFSIRNLCKLDADKMRAWVEAEHDHKSTILALERQVLAVLNGSRW